MIVKPSKSKHWDSINADGVWGVKFIETRMKYEILIKMQSNLDSGEFNDPDHRFLSAVNCAGTSIESILYNHSAIICYEENKIIVTFESPNLFTIDKLKKLLKPAFQDGAGNIYPEFELINMKKIP